MKAEMALGGGEGVGRRSDWLPLTRVHPSQNQAWEKPSRQGPPASSATLSQERRPVRHGLRRAQVPGGQHRGLVRSRDPRDGGYLGYSPVFLVLCKMEGPQRLDLELCPYLPRVSVTKTSASDYMALMPGGGR